MKSIEKKVLSRICGRGKGYAFTSNDFITEFNRNSIDKAFSLLTQQGKIRRVVTGIYDYPKYSELLKQTLSPDIDQVARAFARKSNWRIEVSGESALNMLGLSTQVVAKYIYLSDGPNRKYDIMDTTLEFKKSSLKNIGFKYKESSLIVQALKALGQENVASSTIKKIREQIDEKMYDKILKDTKTVTSWIYETIKEICKEELIDG